MEELGRILRAMESNHIHIFLEKILATAFCPHCKGRVGLKNISVQSVTDRTCVFKMHCDLCNNDVLAQAILNVEDKRGVTQNMPLSTISPKKINESDIFELISMLENDSYQNLSSFFGKQ